jgi:hypothetical protein
MLFSVVSEHIHSDMYFIQKSTYNSYSLRLYTNIFPLMLPFVISFDHSQTTITTLMYPKMIFLSFPGEIRNAMLDIAI